MTHDVEEAVQLSDRVVVMGKRPSHILDIVTVEVSRPRDLDDPACRRLRDHVFRVMGLDHSGQSLNGAGNQEGTSSESLPSSSPRYRSTETPTRRRKRWR